MNTTSTNPLRHPFERPLSPPDAQALKDLVVTAIEDMKGLEIRVLDVRDKTSITDYMIVASGNVDRHVKAIADYVADQARAAGSRPLGMEGANDSEWILLDLGDVIVHIMLPRVRDFYQLEKLWGD